MFHSVCTTIISNIQKSLGKGSSWIMDSVIDHTTSISKHNPLARNRYIKLPKEFDHPRKGLINICNIEDNECFKWSIIRRITKTDIDFTKKLDFKDIRYSVKVKDIHKIKGKNYIGISVTIDNLCRF